MKRILFGMMIAMMAIIPMHSGAPEPKDRCADTHYEWLAKDLKEMETVKVGMTRRQLLAVFETEGGLSQRRIRTYVFRNCGYFKVDVEFKPVGNLQSNSEGPEDEITKISKPFLGWGVID